jgi:TolB protein
VSNLIEGVYHFELKVTDAGGLMAKDTIQVTVNAQPLPLPRCTTNCGKILFASARDGNDEIYTCNADGSDVIRLTNDPAADGQPAWSPDRTRIAFVRSEIYVNIYGGDLYIMNADGSNVVRKTFLGFCMHPTWSPDGNKIAYNDGHAISIMDLTSGAVSQLPNTDGGDWLYPQPDWSPDGTKIAFHSDRNASNYFISDIFTISPDGSGFTLLTPIYSGDLNYFRPAWSPDGTKLSVSINNGTTGSTSGSIGVMNAEGTGLRIIKSGLLLDFYIGTRTSWSHDGTRIAYTENKTIKWVAADGSAAGTIIANGWDADWK